MATDTDLVPAEVVNLSRSGAGVLVKAGALTMNASVSVMFERVEGEITLALTATVVRVQAQDDQAMCGLHFEAAPPDVEETLLKLLKLLAAGRGQGRREHNRVQARVEVVCRSIDAFRAVLKDLSRGGLSVVCPRPVEVGSPLGVQFGVEGHKELVVVEGPVLRVTARSDGRYLVAIKFDAPTTSDRERVERLLSLLVELGPRQGVLLDEEP